MFLLLIKFFLFVGFFEAGILLVHKFVHHSQREIHNNVAGYIYSVVGVIYAVLLAFIVMNVWEQYKDTEKNLNDEISHTMDLYRNTAVFPEEVRKDMQTACVRYLQDMATHEFPAMKELRVSDQAFKSYSEIWNSLYKYKPVNDFEQIWYTECIQELNDLADARRYRIIAINSKIAPLMWYFLIFGATITIGFGYLFGTKNQKAHQLMIILLSVTIGITLLIIEQLDQPFSGLISLSPEPFQLLLEQLRHLL